MFTRMKIAVVMAMAVVLCIAPGFDTEAKEDDRGAGRPDRILILDGSPVHDVGNFNVHVPNWGLFGSMPGSGNTFASAPSAEWPGGSRVEYLYAAGLWIGAVVGGVPAVSTAAYEFEFRPTPDPVDVVYYAAEGDAGGNRVPHPDADDDGDGMIDEEWLDGRDNDADGMIDEDFAAISEDMQSCWYTDDQAGITQIYPEHQPMNLLVRQQSFQWSETEFDQFVGFDYTITNTGNQILEDVYVGVFVDGDAGHRDTPNYYDDDANDFASYPSVSTPWGTTDVEFGYVYDVDGDAGQTTGYCGALILDHTTDPSGTSAPAEAHWVTFKSFDNAGPGFPANDFERYEAMSSETIDRGAVVPRDVSYLVAAGPFAEIAPGETVTFQFALFIGDSWAGIEEIQRRAAAAKLTYEGEWLDLDGVQYQKHWVIPETPPVPVFVSDFSARSGGGMTARLAWDIYADEPVRGFRLLRDDAAGRTVTLPSNGGMLSSDTRTYVDRGVEAGHVYRYTLAAVLADGTEQLSRTVEASIPAALTELHQNHPNPFNPATTISFTLVTAEKVRLSVFTPEGRLVTTLVDESRPAGINDATWDGTDASGNRVSSGLYFYRLEAGKTVLSRKMLLMK
jgi:hypothetical protein